MCIDESADGLVFSYFWDSQTLKIKQLEMQRSTQETRKHKEQGPVQNLDLFAIMKKYWVAKPEIDFFIANLLFLMDTFIWLLLGV
jgi:hypothetical protein